MKRYIIIGTSGRNNPIYVTEAAIDDVLEEIDTQGRRFVDCFSGMRDGDVFLAEFTPIKPTIKVIQEERRAWVLPDQPKPAEKKWRRATMADCGREVVGATWAEYKPRSETSDPSQILLGMDKTGNFIVDRDLGGRRVLPVAWIYE